MSGIKGENPLRYTPEKVEKYEAPDVEIGSITKSSELMEQVKKKIIDPPLEEGEVWFMVIEAMKRIQRQVNEGVSPENWQLYLEPEQREALFHYRIKYNPDEERFISVRAPDMDGGPSNLALQQPRARGLIIIRPCRNQEYSLSRDTHLFELLYVFERKGPRKGEIRDMFPTPEQIDCFNGPKPLVLELPYQQEYSKRKVREEDTEVTWLGHFAKCPRCDTNDRFKKEEEAGAGGPGWYDGVVGGTFERWVRLDQLPGDKPIKVCWTQFGHEVRGHFEEHAGDNMNPGYFYVLD